jgi:hypothetical protein
MDVWPRDLFRPRRETWRILGAVTLGGQSTSGIIQTVDNSGGGFWGAEFRDIAIWETPALQSWRAWELIASNGSAEFIVPTCAKRFSPIRRDGSRVPHSDGTPFSDDTRFVSGGDEYAAAAASLRATRLTLTASPPGVGILGGEDFTIEHATKGPRLYRVMRVDGAQIEVRPPLREAIPAGTVLDFANQRCVMKLAAPEGMTLEIDRNRIGRASPSFVEARW